jgi:hypothetical protein
MTSRPLMRALAEGYSAEVDTVPLADWHGHVSRFRDASIYQAWHHAAGRDGIQGASRLLLRHRGGVVACAEVRLFTVPILRRGLAYVRWGPLWKYAHEVERPEVLRQALRALYNEYVVRRGLILRITPRLALEDSPYLPGLALEEGFSHVPPLTPDRTLRLPLSGSLEDLRKNFGQSWRGHLNKAQRAGLTVTTGTGLELFDDFVPIFNQMLERKGFEPGADIQKHRRLQAALPEHLKMRALVARKDGRPCAGVIYSAIGDTALYLFGATNEIAMQTSAAYLLQWETLRLLKEQGITTYDLHGINPEANPGTYNFKKGLAGKQGTEATFVGQFQAFRASPVNRVLLALERRGRGALPAAPAARPAAVTPDPVASEA